MKNILLILILICALKSANAQYVTIPDSNFRVALKTKYPTCFSGNLMDTTCTKIITDTLLQVSSKNIASLQGIQYFKNLKELNCIGNVLTTLPSLPSTLLRLLCASNKLTSLPVLPSFLQSIYAYSDSLTSLPALPASLLGLDCSKNKLTSLPAMPASLRVLSCTDNKITSLPALPGTLVELDCFNNRIATMPTLSSVLINLWCSNNQLTSLPALPNTLSILDYGLNHITLTSFPTALTELGCANNNLSTLPALPNTLNMLRCGTNNLTTLPALPLRLKTLDCSNNKLSSISISDSVTNLNCSINKIVTLPTLPDSLKYLYCTSNLLNCLPTLPSKLNLLYVKGNNITCLPNAVNLISTDTVLSVCTIPCGTGVNNNLVDIPDSNFRKALHVIYPNCIVSGKLDTSCANILNATSLDVSSKNIVSLEGIQYFKNLRSLSCSRNKLTSLPASTIYNSLFTLDCDNNKLTSLPPLPRIRELDCDVNKLTSLPVLSDTLQYLHCSGNMLTALPALPDIGLFYELGCYSNQLTSLPPIPHTTYLLFCDFNKLTSLPALPNSIIYLYCSHNNLQNLPALPASLDQFSCASNKLSVLPALPNALTYFVCKDNLLTTLPPLPNSITTFMCDTNKLVTMPDLPTSLETFYCSHNNLSSLPSLPERIVDFQCFENQLTSLPKLPDSLQYFYCFNNQLTSLPAFPASLKEVYSYFNQLTILPALPSGLKILMTTDNPLNCLPLIPYNISELLIENTNVSCLPNVLNNHAYVDISIPICLSGADICASNPIVQGKIYNDANNNNNRDSAEQLISQQIIKVLPNNWLGVSDINGNYTVKIDTAINNTWSAINNYRYAIITPTSYSKNPADTLGLINDNYDFGVQFIHDIKDLEAELGCSPARPGFTTIVTVNVNNVGTVNQTNINVKFKKPNGFNVLSTSVSPTATINDTLIWNNISINFLEHQSINIRLRVPANAVIDSSAIYEAWANGTQGDTTPLDNYTTWTDLIRGSFDPNDKMVNKTTLLPTYNAAKDRLLYTIRFQNTGTDTAFTVIVRDIIPDNLDVTSLRVVNASHPYQLIVREKNIVEVTFPNIQLPDKTTNEAKSHGFVQLEFKPKAGLPLNAEINNNASILFDYNAPVVTNTATTKIQITTGIANNKKLAFKLFPNPASEKIAVELPYEGKGKWYLTDISGRIIQQNNIESNSTTFDINVNDVANGTYLLSLEINDVVSSSKVIIVR